MQMAEPKHGTIEQLRSLLDKMNPEQIRKLRKQCAGRKDKDDSEKPKREPAFYVSTMVRCDLCGYSSCIDTKSNTPAPESVSRLKIYWCGYCELTLENMPKHEIIDKLLSLTKHVYPKRIRRE